METIKYCCDIFNDMLINIGYKGFSILPGKIGGKYCFVLQGRNKDILDNTGIQTTFQQTIHFCPWCGSDLSYIIDKNKHEMDKYVELNKDIVL